jgi:SAM-dependent methyltransferase
VEELSGDPRLTASADLVICCELIEHVTDTLEFLRALSGLAKPGGHILITGLSASGFDIEVLGENSNAVSPPHHLTFLSRRGVESLVKRSGLKLVYFETPGKLDVDIVKNALNKDPKLEMDRFIRNLILESDQETRESLQQFLSTSGLSSHMWAVIQNSVTIPETHNNDHNI